ncbi:redoxin domain-containing protein [Fluviicola sp.]|uniref:TlpA family protein disulfide reductase n=1 Tax=Fluviicola sp. TaxID=1917219 RepID=UPI00262C2127|nr:redoxin domain-containing protein [Fluviicola sp.]
MNKYALLLFLFSFGFTGIHAQSITEITGYAPAYIGKEVELYEISDFITLREERIASTTVKADSSFNLVFNLDETRKLILKAANNKANLYASPGAKYEVFFPEKNQYDPYNPSGNFIELSFFNLDKKDINYKILEFNRWNDEFVARYYTKKNADSKYFVARLDTFKMAVEKYYLADTVDKFFGYHRKYTIAKLDDLRFTGSRNQYEKYDFYIRSTPVYYQSEAYFQYISHFYEKLLPRINSEINNRIYLGILKSSPSAIYNAMSKEYTLQHNYKLRELVMLKTLSECFYEKDYPQTNILTILDSVSKFGLFPENRIVAQNIRFRLTELSQGSKAPDFLLKNDTKDLTLQSFSKKYLYLFFIDPNSLDNTKQMNLLKPIYERYKDIITFVMVYKEKPDGSIDVAKLKNEYPWTIIPGKESNSIFKNYNVVNYPYYVLIDPFGYVINAPALGPMPNGVYETIDRTFFMIQKALKDGNGADR